MKLAVILLILIIPTILIQAAYAQKTASQRFISYAKLTDPLNAPFLREGDVTDILFKGASKGLIPLYFFDSFKKPPKSFSWSQLAARLLEFDQQRFRPWERGLEYPLGAEVSYQDDRYRSLIENNGRSPFDNYYGTAWTWIRSLHDIVGLDYQTNEAGIKLVHYLHFFTDDFKYEASFLADDAANFLNATGYLWYRIEDHFIYHLKGNIFLFDYYDEKKINDLWSLLDTVKLKITKEIIVGTESRLGLHSGYHNGRITEFLLSREDEREDFTSAFLDTIPVSEIRKSLLRDSTEFYLLGDAMLKPDLFKLSENHPIVELKPVKIPWVQIKSKQVDTITYRTIERFRLFGQGLDPNAFDKDVGDLMNLLYIGIAEKRVNVYSSDSLTKPYTPDELVKAWTVGSAPDNWDEKKTYWASEEAFYKGVVYVAQEDSVVEPPSGRAEKWKTKRKNEEIFQPDDIQQVEFTYRIIFTKSGELVNKEPCAIGIRCKDNNFMTTLGYLNFRELKRYVMETDPALWKKIEAYIQGQNGVYQTIKNGPLRLYKR